MRLISAQLPGSTTGDLAIALRKGKCNCTQQILISFLISFILLLFIISSLDSCSVLKNVSLSLSSWTKVMQKKMTVLEQNKIWELVHLEKKPLGASEFTLSS